ncbi:hypothetical protein VNO78_25423 [Psophocarpus tetragonolobus]|uniref:Uncharacterized protein n=1 Tax=Psophocarpus tetragonolobus TaxID=3891 RepID=A0AAN9S5W0_PSOTE
MDERSVTVHISATEKLAPNDSAKEERVAQLDAIRGYNDKDLVWMLFVDGCSVLQIMHKLDAMHPEELWIKFDQQERAITDLLLLENQIPYKVLELLNHDEHNLVSSMLNLRFNGFMKNNMLQDIVPRFCQDKTWDRILEGLLLEALQMRTKPNHVLDFIHFIMFQVDHVIQRKQQDSRRKIFKGDREVTHIVWPRYKNIRELRAAGIRVRGNETICLSNVSFVSRSFFGVLKIPWLYVDEYTPYFFLNMVAYERCPDNFHNNYEMCSYLAFLNTLIDDANDVKELRVAGVLQNLLGSDEEVAGFLNHIGTELASREFYLCSTGKMAYSKTYTKVKYEIEKHCGNSWKTWLAQAYIRHFSNPWSTCAFLAAVLALVLTAIQTWFTIYPNK